MQHTRQEKQIDRQGDKGGDTETDAWRENQIRRQLDRGRDIDTRDRDRQRKADRGGDRGIQRQTDRGGDRDRQRQTNARYTDRLKKSLHYIGCHGYFTSCREFAGQ